MIQKIPSVSSLYQLSEPTSSTSMPQNPILEVEASKEPIKFFQMASYLKVSKMFISSLLVFAMLTSILGARYISEPMVANAATAAFNTKFTETLIIPAGKTLATLNYEPIVVGTPVKVPGATVTVNADDTILVVPDAGLVGELNIPYQVENVAGDLTDLAIKNIITPTATPTCTLAPAKEIYSMYRNDIKGVASDIAAGIDETTLTKEGPDANHTRRIATLTITNKSTTETYYDVKYPIMNFYGRGVLSNTAATATTPGNFEKAFYDAAGNYFEVPTETRGLDTTSPGYRFQVEDNTANPQNTTAVYEPVSNLPDYATYLTDGLNIPNNTQTASQIVPTYYLPNLAPGQSAQIKIAFYMENMPLETGIEYFAYQWDDTVIAQKEVCTSKLELIKVGTLVDTNANGYSDAGDVINYTFTVKNTGSLDVTNINITDPKITVVGGPLATLAKGATDSTTFTGTHTLTAADIAATTVENTATVSATDSTGKTVSDISDSDDTTKPGQDDPTIISLIPQLIPVTPPASKPPIATNDINNTALNTPITYNPMVNDRNAVGATITAIDGKPVTIGVPIKITGGTVVVNADGTITVTPDQDYALPLEFSYTITTPEGKTATAIDKIQLDNIKIALDKAAKLNDTNGDGISQVGETIDYKFTVKNVGDQGLIDFKIIDPVITVVGGPISILPPGASDSTTFTGTYTLTQKDIDAGKVDNQAVLAATDSRGKMVVAVSNDPSTTEEEDITIVPLLKAPKVGKLEVIKSGTWNDTNSNGYSDVGDTIKYSFKVTNTGEVELTDVTISDAKVTVTGTLPKLAIGAIDTTTFTGTYTLTAADIAAGKVDNTAIASGKTPDGKIIKDTSDSDDPTKPGTDDPTVVILTPMPLIPSITLDKEGTLVDDNGDGLLNLGEKITYKFKVTNTGNTIVSNIKISDPLPGIVITGSPITLKPGEVDSTTFTATYIVKQKDIDAGTVTNQAVATGQDPTGKDVSAVSNDPKTTQGPDATVIPLPAIGKIELIKLSQNVDANNDGYSSIGDYIKYFFGVKNMGNVTLTNVVITDNKATVTGGPIATLAPEQTDTTTYTGLYYITQADIDAGKVENSAVVKAKDPKGNDITDVSDSGDKNKTGPDDPTVTMLVSKPVVPIVPPIPPVVEQPTVRTGAGYTFLTLSISTLLAAAMVILISYRTRRYNR